MAEKNLGPDFHFPVLSANIHSIVRNAEVQTGQREPDRTTDSEERREANVKRSLEQLKRNCNAIHEMCREEREKNQ